MRGSTRSQHLAAGATTLLAAIAVGVGFSGERGPEFDPSTTPRDLTHLLSCPAGDQIGVVMPLISTGGGRYSSPREAVSTALMRRPEIREHEARLVRTDRGLAQYAVRRQGRTLMVLEAGNFGGGWVVAGAAECSSLSGRGRKSLSGPAV